MKLASLISPRLLYLALVSHAVDGVNLKTQEKKLPPEGKPQAKHRQQQDTHHQEVQDR